MDFSPTVRLDIIPCHKKDSNITITPTVVLHSHGLASVVCLIIQVTSNVIFLHTHFQVSEYLMKFQIWNDFFLGDVNYIYYFQIMH